MHYFPISFAPQKPMLFSALLLFALPCFAEEDFSAEAAYFQEMPVILTASRLAQPLSDSPSAVTVIDKKMIQASGARSIAELFRLVPGMYVDYSNGNTPIVSLGNNTDGFARRMQVLVDGRSIYMQPAGGVEWAELPFIVSDIERIEVIRGPSAASHGANSLFGVINIITLDAAAQHGGSVSISKGQFGISDASAALGKVGDEVDFRLTAGYRSETEGGFRSRNDMMFARTDYPFSNDTQVLNDGSSLQLVNFRTNYHPTATDSVDVQVGFSQGYRGIGIYGRPNKDPFRDRYSENDFVQIGLQHVYRNGDESKLKYARTYRYYSDAAMPVVKVSGAWQDFYQDDSRAVQHDVELQNIVQLGDSHRVVLGGGVRYDYVDRYQWLGEPRSTRQYRIFGHDEWRIFDNALINIGNMMESDGMSNTSHSPRVSVNWHLTPEHTLRMGYSTAVRNPMLGEWYIGAGPKSQPFDVGRGHVTSTGLNPERMEAKEIGWVADFKQANLTLDMRAHIDNVSGIIYDNLATLSPMQLEFKNLLKEEIRGVDASVKHSWERGFVVGSYAWQTITCDFSQEPSYYSVSVVHDYFRQGWLETCPESVPRHSASVLISQQLGDQWQLSSALYLRSPMRITNSAAIADYPPESTMRRVDVRLAYRFGDTNPLGGGEIALVVQNATQDNYTKYALLPEERTLIFLRRAYLTVTTNF